MTTKKIAHRDVLIVDDDIDIRDTLAAVLQEEGFVPRLASNGRAALDQLESAPSLPGLILLDLMMPVMDGWQFRNEQRGSPYLASIPVVVVSADSNLQEKAAALGVEGYLRKPVRLTSLIETVQRFCAESSNGGNPAPAR